MNLPADVARCVGRDETSPLHAMPAECYGCRRRTDRSTFPLQVWMAPPQTVPCPFRWPPIGPGVDIDAVHRRAE